MAQKQPDHNESQTANPASNVSLCRSVLSDLLSTQCNLIGKPGETQKSNDRTDHDLPEVTIRSCVLLLSVRI